MDRWQQLARKGSCAAAAAQRQVNASTRRHVGAGPRDDSDLRACKFAACWTSIVKSIAMLLPCSFSNGEYDPWAAGSVFTDQVGCWHLSSQQLHFLVQ